MQRFRFPLAPEGLVVLAALYFAAVCNARFWDTLAASQRPAPGTALFLGATFALLTALHVLLLLPFSSRYTVRPVLTLLLVGSAASIHFIDRYGVRIDASMMRNVLQTDAREAGELLNAGLFGALALYAALPVGVVWLVRFERRTHAAGLRRKLLCGALALLLVALPAAVFYGRYASFFRGHRTARYLVTPANYVVSTAKVAIGARRAAAGPRRPIGEDATRAAAGPGARPLAFVLVLGETARAANFSLNGYARETNPELRRAGIVNFPRVTACGTATAESVPCLFSRFGRRDFDADGPREESLLDVLQRAGMRVVWLDNNSGCKGACDGVEARQLDKSCGSNDCFDQLLVDETRRLLEAPAEAGGGRDLFLVLHMRGSHGPAYYRRYPPEFERFRPACTSQDFADCTTDEIRNAYDNTILYTDHVLAELIALLGADARHDGALLYVSDHGESLGENGLYLHGLPWSLAPDTQKQVPMLYWGTPGFEDRAGLDRQRLQALAAREYAHDNVFHSLLGVLGVRTGLYEPGLDLFAPARDGAVAEGRPDVAPPLAPGVTDRTSR